MINSDLIQTKRSKFVFFPYSSSYLYEFDAAGDAAGASVSTAGAAAAIVS